MGLCPVPSLFLMALTVIFDLDGTLVDSAEDVGAMINPLFAQVGRPGLTRDQVVACFGLGAQRFVMRALALTAGPALLHAQLADLTQRFMAVYAVAEPVRSVAYPGVAEALGDCRAAGWRLGVCTNKPYAAAEILLRHLGLRHWFDGVSGGDSIAVRKPDPAHLRDAIARAGGDPARAIMVGDSEADAACAIAANIPVVLIAGGYGHAPLERLGADRILPDFADLPETLALLDPGR